MTYYGLKHLGAGWPNRKDSGGEKSLKGGGGKVMGERKGGRVSRVRLTSGNNRGRIVLESVNLWAG